MRTNDTSGDQRAVEWLSTHAPRTSRVLVDATVWTDLVDRGFDRSHIVWFYKLDLDPAVFTPWWRFDYVVRSNLMAGNLDLATPLQSGLRSQSHRRGVHDEGRADRDPPRREAGGARAALT